MRCARSRRSTAGRPAPSRSGAFDDLGPNGLQVPGAEEVELVVTGVTAQLELFERATDEGAQLVICHHGLFWDFLPRTVDAVMRDRLRALFGADISLAGYHPVSYTHLTLPTIYSV